MVPEAHWGYGAAGTVLLLFTMLDALWTTMHRGGGPVTRLLVGPLWSLLRHTRHFGLGSHRAMSVAGLLLVLLTVLVWVVMVWAGWTMVFMADPGAVLRSDDGMAATTTERVYFTGFTVFTLGVGDYVPARDGAWQVLTPIASFTGFFLITFVITYLGPVVSNAVTKRAFASRILALGDSPEEIVMHSTRDGSLGRLAEVLDEALAQVATLQQAHDAYPVLHFFHDLHEDESLAVAIARLDEAVRLANTAFVTGPACHPGLARQWSVLVDRLLDTMNTHGGPVDVPPLPRRAMLRGLGLTLVDEATFARQFGRDAGHRRRLAALLRGHGWAWSHVTGHRAGPAEVAPPGARSEPGGQSS